jgi:hypothetical protein
MKSIHILIATSVLLILAISPVAAQGQGQTVRPEGDGTQQKTGQQDGQQTKNGYGRENPYERTYERPYERKKMVRPVITGDHMIGLDGGLDPTEAELNGGINQPAGAPRNNWFGGGGNVGGGGGNVGGGGNFRGSQPASSFGNAGNAGGAIGRTTNSGPRVSVVNGVRTIEVEESSRKIKIIEDPQKGIYIEITKQYGPKELASLKNRMPDLGEYIDLFPEQLNNSDIELTIGVTSKYSAANAEDLERQDQGAYNVYRRFANVQSNSGQSNNFQQSQRQGPASQYWGQQRPTNLPTSALSGGGATGR